MSKFVVEGGHKLSGNVRINGSKNAAFPVIAASILAQGTSQITNVPDISDVRNFLNILQVLGAEYEFENNKLSINTDKLKNQKLTPDLVGRLRGSVLLAGVLLARFGKVSMPHPGGDAIGARPIDVHLDGFARLGAKISEQELIEIEAHKLKGTKIVLDVTSVTGTENLILASILAKGVTKICLAATEPHVQSLCKFLNKMGAKIKGIGTPNLQITGVEKLQATDFSLNADEIEALTFCIAAAASKSHITVSNVEPENLDAPLSVLQRMNVNFLAHDSQIEILKPIAAYKGTKIVTGVFPHLLTDEQPLLGVLATQAQGETLIHDWIYEGRQGYLKALQKMGAKVEFLDAHQAKIFGPSALNGTEIATPDIRAGATILIAALVAKGQTTLYNAEIIDRGYEKLDERLNSLGARIKRIN